VSRSGVPSQAVDFPQIENEMAWVRPQYSRGQVDSAGRTLIRNRAENATLPELIAFDEAVNVINNWRSSHSYPLHALKMALRNRAREVDRKAVVAQRLKRLSSIATKLARNDNMKLSQMQDIGGCRAVVKDVSKVDRLLKTYMEVKAKNPNVRAEYVKTFDYITNPKVDGYRCIHLIYKYRSQSPQFAAWKGLRIEIQLRSILQHAWATAVETVDAFTGQALKTSGGTGTEKRDWGRFFALMSSAIATREKRALVPDTPIDVYELTAELRQLAEQLNVEPKLRGWSYAMKIADERAHPDDVLFLLVVDTVGRTIRLVGYRDMKEAQDAYLRREKELKPDEQAVLVSVDSLDAVRAAYPNYYADTTVFLDALNLAVFTVPIELPGES
jgi:ppGpp synthetase/RelA/SpoT-type nucleotidyltranferase